MQTSPGALVFQRNMRMIVLLVANLYSIQQRKQQLIDAHLRTTKNARHIQQNYSIGDRVMAI